MACRLYKVASINKDISRPSRGVGGGGGGGGGGVGGAGLGKS